MSYKDIIFCDLEKQYSPSKWSHRGTPEDVLKAHVEFVEKVSLKTKIEIPCELDIEMGYGQKQKIDIFGTHLPKTAPWFVYVHGGYWQELSRELSSYPVAPLVESGVRVAIPGYDLCPEVTLTDIVTQAKEIALFCLQKSYGMGCRSLTFCGHSAGAHLVAMILSEDFLSSLSKDLLEIISGICFISGIFDLEPLLHTTVNDKLQLTSAEVQNFSPICHKYNTETKRNIKILIAVGQFDSQAFQMQSEAFTKILNTAFSNVLYELIADCDHFNIVENLHSPNYMLTKKILHRLINV